MAARDDPSIANRIDFEHQGAVVHCRRAALLQEFVELSPNTFPANVRGRLYCAMASATLGLLGAEEQFEQLRNLLQACKDLQHDPYPSHANGNHAHTLPRHLHRLMD